MPEVPSSFAKACMDNFDKLMKGNNLEQIHKAFSFSVTFEKSDLENWLNANSNADHFRISFGVYNDKAPDYTNRASDEGRLTAFVWAINDGTEQSAYNGGALNP